MASAAPAFIPVFVGAMVTWKIMYCKKTSKFTGATPSLRSTAGRSFNQTSSVSERLAARNIQHSRTKSNSDRNSLSNAKGIAGKQQPKKSPFA